MYLFSEGSRESLLGVSDGQHAGTELIWKSGVISKSGFTTSNSIHEGQGVGEGVRSVFVEHAN